VILGVTFLHEELTWQLVTGAILIITSLVIANWQPQKQASHQKRQATTS
jgi:drug/metabolite transporter (DMT)-like permease